MHFIKEIICTFNSLQNQGIHQFGGCLFYGTIPKSNPLKYALLQRIF